MLLESTEYCHLSNTGHLDERSARDLMISDESSLVRLGRFCLRLQPYYSVRSSVLFGAVFSTADSSCRRSPSRLTRSRAFFLAERPRWSLSSSCCRAFHLLLTSVGLWDALGLGRSLQLSPRFWAPPRAAGRDVNSQPDRPQSASKPSSAPTQTSSSFQAPERAGGCFRCPAPRPRQTPVLSCRASL